MEQQVDRNALDEAEAAIGRGIWLVLVDAHDNEVDLASQTEQAIDLRLGCQARQIANVQPRRRFNGRMVLLQGKGARDKEKARWRDGGVASQQSDGENFQTDRPIDLSCGHRILGAPRCCPSHLE